MHSGQASEGYYYSFIHAAQVSATEWPGILYSSLQILSACSTGRNMGTLTHTLNLGENDRFAVSRIQLERAPRLKLVGCSEGTGSNPHKWSRFDDGEVIEAKVDNDEVHVRDNVLLL